jgi:ClpP class serine protease
MKQLPPLSTAPLAALLSQVPLMRPEAHGALIRDCLPILLGRPEAMAALSARFASLTSDDDEPDDPMPWDIGPEEMIDLDDAVATVAITGTIATGVSAFEAWAYGMTRTEDISDALSLCARLPVSAVVLAFNSPGGFTMGTPELADQVGAMAKSGRQIVVSFSAGQMCSAAYWIGSQAKSVYATQSAQIGCVGVYATFYDHSKMLADAGVAVDVIASGAYKGMGTFGTSLSKEQRAFMQADVDRTAARFTAAVKSTRSGVSDDILNGQWYDGILGCENGLCDRVVPSLASLVSELNTRLQPFAIPGYPG